MKKYHFGVPGIFIWSTHVLLGLYFTYIGYKLTENINMKIHGIILIVLGALMAFYHIHIFLLGDSEHQ